MMEREEMIRAMPAIRRAWAGLKGDLEQGNMAAVGRALFGDCLDWGDDLGRIYREDGRDALMARDPLTRFFVTRFRGMPVSADLAGAPGHAVFLMAFTAFPYLDALMDELDIGDAQGVAENGDVLVRQILAGDDTGDCLAVRPCGAAWSFDLMAVFTAKSQALADYIRRDHADDFDAFLWRYVADHDLAFDRDQAWRPLSAPMAPVMDNR